MRIIGLIGYGNLGLQIESLVLSTSSNYKFIYFDDIAHKQKIKNAFPFNRFLDDQFGDVHFIVALGYKHLERKKTIIENLILNKRNLFTYINPGAIINKSAIIDVGTIIYPNVTIDKNVSIGKGCLLHLSVTISHDTFIDDCCFLAPSVTLSGFVSIGKMVFIGTGVCVANNIIIQDSAIIGIGSVITKNVEQKQCVIGNPQKIVKKIDMI
jgi:acetyltransferase EpsM